MALNLAVGLAEEVSRLALDISRRGRLGQGIEAAGGLIDGQILVAIQQ